jgi:hypothetical protein
LEINPVSKPHVHEELNPLADLTRDRCPGCGPIAAEEWRALAERLGDRRPPLLTVVCPTCVRKFDAALDPAPQEAVAS